MAKNNIATNKSMKKLTIQDLPFLTESDKGLLFDYFTSVSAANFRPKMAFGFAAMGVFFLALVYFSSGIIAEADGIPDIFKSAQMFFEISLPIVTLLAVISNLFLARSLRRDAANYKNELTVRGLDVSGLTFDEVFNHVAMPMFRRQGLKIEE